MRAHIIEHRRSLRRRPATWLGLGTSLLVVVAVLAVGLWAFQPWKAFTSSTVDEALPVADVTDLEGREPPPPPAPADGPGGGPAVGPAEMPDVPEMSELPPPPPPAEPVVLAEGTFVSQEHGTEGTARVLQLADGSRFVRFEGLSTSDGPDLQVWLSDQDAGGDWFKYDSGRSVELGELTATDGNQNYEIPADVPLDGLNSVVIWCERFSVAFGSAPLDL